MVSPEKSPEIICMTYHEILHEFNDLITTVEHSSIEVDLNCIFCHTSTL